MMMMMMKMKKKAMLCVKWWNETFEKMQGEEFRMKRENAAKRVGLWVTKTKPADTSYLPKPVRFHGTVFQFFGEILYDESHPDYGKEKKYDFAWPAGTPPVIAHIQAEDEDGFSFEEPTVYMEEEEGNAIGDELEEEEESSEEDLPLFRAALQARRSRRHASDAPQDKIVGQYDALHEANSTGIDARRRQREASKKRAKKQ